MGRNTTALIGKWSMDGAHGFVVGGFRSSLDILAIVSARSHEPSSVPAAPTPAPLLLKPAGEGDWQPLLGAEPA
jgi:hypothetical protein